MNYNKTLNLPKTKFSMKANLPLREPLIHKMWEEKKIYQKLLEKNLNCKKFILHDGPPYANGHIHIGHALNRILKDIIIKYKAMTGHYTPFVPGWDCHGLPVEYELIKTLPTGEIQDKVKFRRQAANYALKFVNIQKKEFKRLGLFGDWDNPYLTLAPEYEAKIIESFKELYMRGYIYRELKPVYWCPSCRTALAEAEVEYADISSPSIFVKFELISKKPDFVKENEKVYALIWTTTPWTLPANMALCFHPDFEYSFIKKVEGPLPDDEYLIVAKKFAAGYKNYKEVSSLKGSALEGYEFKIPIVPFGERISKGINGNFVTLEDGTGIVHIAPGHGDDDYIIAKKYNLKVFAPVDEDGRFTSEVDIQELIGKDVFESDPLVVELLKKNGMLFSSDKIVHSYPHCWRCKSRIVFRATKQWFLNVDKDDLRSKILEKIKNITWYPAVSVRRITTMIENRPDWCLSRQRLWGVPVPVFYCNDCNEVIADEESFNKVVELIRDKGADGWYIYSANEILGDNYTCKCGSKNIEKEEDILDVWFDSGVSHFAVLKTNEPADMYLEGSDQHRGWFQASLIPAVAIRNIPPYKSVFTHGFIVDADGKKMSKSLGNVISPQDIVSKYGADLLRIWVASENYFKDIKISNEILQQMVTSYRRIRNTIRFILGNISDLKESDVIDYNDLTPLDKFILHKFAETIQNVLENYENYLFYKSVTAIHDFCNITLSSFYFNILKDRLYVLKNDSHMRRSSQTVLRAIGEILLKILSPVLSHTAEEGWQVFINERPDGGVNFEESIFLTDPIKIPDSWKNPDIVREFEKIIQLRNIVLKAIEEAKEEGAGKVKDPLEVEVDIAASQDPFDFIQNKKADLKEYFIVSEVKISLSDISDGIDFSGGKVKVSVEMASGEKCVRCWMKVKDVGKNSTHPELCSRCVDIVSD